MGGHCDEKVCVVFHGHTGDLESGAELHHDGDVSSSPSCVWKTCKSDGGGPVTISHYSRNLPLT